MTWRIIYDQRDRAKEWARIHFPATYPETDKFVALIHEWGGEIRAAVFYTDFYPANSIDLHVAAVAGKKWLTSAFLTATFEYPFGQLGLRRVTGRIASSNKRARNFVERIGFTQEGIVREGWPTGDGDDLIIYGMLRRECRFFGSEIPKQMAIRPERGMLALDRHA